MAEPEDDKLAERYRALGSEQPPPALDAKILAAARRETHLRRAPRRWVLPLSLAALLVLSVSVTLQMQHERPDLENETAAPAQAGKAAVPAAPAPSAADRAAPAHAAEPKAAQRAAGATTQQGRPSRESGAESPEQWLARIAELRREGHDAEADRRLAEFRRRFPDYRIPQPVREKVERR